MAAEGGRIDFMFLGPPPYPAAGSATGLAITSRITWKHENELLFLELKVSIKTKLSK